MNEANTVTARHNSEYNALGNGILGAVWFINNVKVRLVGTIISGLMLIMLGVGVASGVWSAVKVGNIGTHWHGFDTGAASKRALMDQIRHRIGYGGLLFQVKEVMQRNGDAPTAISAAKEAAGKIRALTAAYRSAGVSLAEDKALVGLTEVIAAYEGALDQASRATGPAALAPLLAIKDDAIGPALATLSEAIRQESEVSSRAVDSALTGLSVSIFSSLTLNTILLLVLAVFFHWFTRHRIVAPLDAMVHVMDRLTHGDKSVTVPFQDKNDEIGGMARAVEVFKENAIRIDRMAEERRQAETASEEAKRQQMQALADRFEREVKGVVTAVSGAAGELQSLAHDMTSMAERAQSSTGDVAAASARLTNDVSTSAAAAEELSVSIQEIRRQVGDSSTMAANAVKEAERAREVMGDLSLASERIDHIVQLIEGLAHRIDLLALNATIEAMRAGEYGKGFAVVANEVKNLSAQTAKATGDITEQIENIKSVSGDAVRAIGAISASIEQLNTIAGSVASAVAQQSEATGEITRGIDRTASETRVVSQNMTEVAQLNTETGDSAKKVLGASKRLGEDASRLTAQVGAFVEHVRAT